MLLISIFALFVGMNIDAVLNIVARSGDSTFLISSVILVKCLVNYVLSLFLKESEVNMPEPRTLTDQEALDLRCKLNDLKTWLNIKRSGRDDYDILWMELQLMNFMSKLTNIHELPPL